MYRRNVFENNEVSLKINNQGDSNGVYNERTQIYENIFICTDPGVSESIRKASSFQDCAATTLPRSR